MHRFSATMIVTPDLVLTILKAIFDVGAQIYATAQRVRANRHRSTRLSERINETINLLQPHRLLSQLGENVAQVLENFLAFLEHCQDFIQGFTDANWFQEIYRNNYYARKFKNLNVTLDQHERRMSFAFLIGITRAIFSNKVQEDEEDRQKDEFENAIIMEAESK